MATIVIIHGGWGGGWEWTPVARKLRQRGHDVFTPTLTGLGEREHRDGKIPPPTEQFIPKGSLPEERRMRYINRTLPHPAATMTEPVRLSGAVANLPRAFVRCTGVDDPDADLMAPFAARARAEGWRYREIATPHDLQLFDPDGTAAVAHDLATSFD